MSYKHRDVDYPDGSKYREYSIGVEPNHPFADLENHTGSGLYNMRVGELRFPAAPTFYVKLEKPNESRANLYQTEITYESMRGYVNINPRIENA